jgi:hypothetical protein
MGFGVLKMKSAKNSRKLHFGVTKKDPNLVFHFHFLNLFFVSFSIKAWILKNK